MPIQSKEKLLWPKNKKTMSKIHLIFEFGKVKMIEQLRTIILENIAFLNFFGTFAEI